MGVKIYRDDNWDRLQCGAVSRRDITGLDRERDRCLIEWIVLHAPEHIREAAMSMYQIAEMPEEQFNTDDPDDEIWPVYSVLREQAEREDSVEELKKAAFGHGREPIGRFAFCRLTGFSWPPDECDAYSYRTYRCGIASGVTVKDAEELCREMIEKEGPFAAEAGEWLEKLLSGRYGAGI